MKSPHNLCLYKPLGIKAEWDREYFRSPRQFLLKDFIWLTSSELQHCDSTSKSTRDTQGEAELSGIRARVGERSFLPDKSTTRGHCSFDEPSSNRDSRQVPCLSVHQPGTQYLLHPGDSLRPCPTKLEGSPFKLPLLSHVLDFSKISQTSNIWPLQAMYQSTLPILEDGTALPNAYI